MTKKTKIIGLTGGIATGKSSVSEILRNLDQTVICADALAHAATDPKSPALAQIRKVFGHTVFRQDKTLNRQILAEIVFADPKKKERLEKIIHPWVRKEMRTLIRNAKREKKTLVFLDIPLLFESELDSWCDEVICVATSQKIQMERLQKYRKMSQVHALKRIRSQMPIKEKVKRADHVIWNSGRRSELRKQVRALLQKLLTESAK